MFVPEDPVQKRYSPKAVRASMWFLVCLFVGAWVLYFFVALDSGFWPNPTLPIVLTGGLIYGLYRNRRR
jgi:hypothetical protein